MDRPSSGPKRNSQIVETDNNSAVQIHIQDPSLPAIHLRIHPVTHEGAEAFTTALPDIGSCLRKAVHTCWKLLYNNEAHLFPRNIRSITLYVRPMGGIAYTTGNWLDGENKDIHLSAEYVQRQPEERVRDEIRGVLVHEMVHVWQHNGPPLLQGRWLMIGMGTAPGGLIEGVADYIRLRAGFVPPHWKRGRGSRWDEGYDVTGYFLDWIEKRHAGFVRGVNAILKDAKWDEGVFKLITGLTVDELWKKYRKEMDEKEEEKTVV